MAQRKSGGGTTRSRGTSTRPTRQATSAAAKKKPAKRAVTKKTAAKKAPVKKPVKKAPAKKPAVKAAVKKAPVKKAPAKKAAVKKAPAKKAAAKKPVVKKPAKKAPAKKPVAKKTPAKKATVAVDKPAKVAAKPPAPLKVAATKAAAKPSPGARGRKPLTPAERKEMRGVLLAERRRLEAEIAEAVEDLNELLRDSGDGSGDDQADAGSKTFEREHEMSVANNSRDLLEQVEHALARIADGSYGTCESCGLPIGKMRLEAFPRATLCVDCKQREERR
jgi:RNA polymerase-binding protein DksA